MNSSDNFSKSGFLRTSRSFPPDVNSLSVQLSKTYIEIARSVNHRMIGFFPTNRSVQNGENWFFNSAERQPGFRQVYQWDDSNLTIPHGIQFLSLTNFSRIWGTFFDGTNWQTLPYVDVAAANNQINVKVNVTNIVITKGAGTPPTCTNGLVVLEFIANPQKEIV